MPKTKTLKSYVEQVVPYLKKDKFSFSKLSDQSRQDARILLLENSIIDFWNCISSTKDTLDIFSSNNDATNQESNVIKTLSKIMEQAVDNIKKDNFTQLLFTCTSPGALLSKLNLNNIPDPAGIIGGNNNRKLYQSRYGRSFFNKAMKSAFESSNNIQHAVQPSISMIPLAANNISATDLMMSNSLAVKNMLDTMLNVNFDNVTVPEITSENYVRLIAENFREKFGQEEVNIEVINSYTDAVMSMLNNISNNEPINAVEIASAEFIQNIRMRLISKHIENIKSLVDKFPSILKNMGEEFSQQIYGSYKTDFLYEEFQNNSNKNINAREAHQNAQLAISASELVNIANYLSDICDNCFSKNIRYNLSKDFIEIGLSFGADPNFRPQDGLKQNNERPTILHLLAKKGDVNAVSAALRNGANPNSLVTNLQTWGEWIYTWVQPFRQINAWFNGKRSPILEGNTPLLDASFSLLNAQENEYPKNEKKYLDVIITMIGYGADMFIYDKYGNSPYNILCKYIRNNGKEISANYTQESLYNDLTNRHNIISNDLNLGKYTAMISNEPKSSNLEM